MAVDAANRTWSVRIEFESLGRVEMTADAVEAEARLGSVAVFALT